MPCKLPSTTLHLLHYTPLHSGRVTLPLAMALNSLLSALPCPPIRLAHCLSSTPLHHSALPSSCPAICALQRTAPLCRTRTTKNLGQIPTCRIRGAADAWCRTRGPQAKQDPGHYDRDYFELRKCHDWATLYFKWGVGISGMNGITVCPNLMMLPNTAAKYCHTSVSLKTQGNFGGSAKKNHLRC